MFICTEHWNISLTYRQPKWLQTFIHTRFLHSNTGRLFGVLRLKTTPLLLRQCVCTFRKTAHLRNWPFRTSSGNNHHHKFPGGPGLGFFLPFVSEKNLQRQAAQAAWTCNNQTVSKQWTKTSSKIPALQLIFTSECRQATGMSKVSLEICRNHWFIQAIQENVCSKNDKNFSYSPDELHK